MRYRARVIPLYEGHKQMEKGFWAYREGASPQHAQRFLMLAYPYPQYYVETPIPDPRREESHEERMTRQEAKQITKGYSNPGNKVRIVCAWCGKEMGYGDGEGVNGVSHSICDECYEDLHGIPKYYIITNKGKTIFNEGDTVASGVLKRENERVIRLGEMPASARSKGGA